MRIQAKKGVTGRVYAPEEVSLAVRGPGGLELKNPVAAPSGVPGASLAILKRCIDAGVSMVEIKTASAVKELHGVRRVGGPGFLDRYNMAGSYSITTSGSPGALTLEHAVELVEGVKEYAREHGVLVVASYGFDSFRDIEAYQKAARAIEAAGADIFKLNAGCPSNYKPWPPPAELLEGLVRAIKQKISIPVVGKWHPNWSIPELIAGLDGLVPAVDGVEIQACCPTYIIDVETARPLGPKSFFHGHGTRVFGVNTAYETYRYLKTVGRDMPICSTAGISTWRDAVERMMVGATYVSLHTALQYRGYRIFSDVIEGMRNFLATHGYRKASDIIGIATPWMNNAEWEAEWSRKYTVPREKAWITVDRDRCNGCRRCEVCIWDAIHVIDGVATVDLALCERCALCRSLCPRDAITLGLVGDNKVT